jgi:hypothetical protein
VTDIILFTGRDDNIGKIAKKIIGKKHSLELDRNSTKYDLEKDRLGRIKKMVFTEGKITGLSVLGDKQTPGFTGSEFFTERERTLEDLINQYKDIKEELHIQNFSEMLASEKIKDGGVEMNFSTDTIAAMNDFMKETYDERMKEVFKSVVEKFGQYIQVVQMSEDAVVFVDYEDGQYYRVTYSGSDAGYEFSEKIQVKPRFLTEDEINNTFEETDPVAEADAAPAEEPVQEDVVVEEQPQEEQVVTEEVVVEEPVVEQPVDEKFEAFKNFIRATYDEIQKGAVKEVAKAFGDMVQVVQWSSVDDVVVFQDYTDGYYYRVGFIMDNETETLEFGPKVMVKPRYLTDMEIDMVFPEGKNYMEDGMQMTAAKTVIADGSKVFTADEISQIEKDRVELEGYRIEAKKTILSKYVKFLTKEEIEKYTNSIAAFTIAELEKELSFVAMQKLLNDETNNENGNYKAAKFLESSNEKAVKSESDRLKDLVNRYK